MVAWIYLLIYLLMVRTLHSLAQQNISMANGARVRQVYAGGNFLLTSRSDRS